MPTMNLRRGDDFVVAFKATFESADKDITGYAVAATLRYANCTPVDMTVNLTNELTGDGELVLDETQTADLQIGTHVLQMRVTSPSGRGSSSLPVTVEVRD